MKHTFVTIAAVLMLFSGGCTGSKHSDVTVNELRCEYRTEPLGIDVKEPRLSWILESKQRCCKQSAYRILVASSEEELDAGKGGLWDTGKIASDQSIHLVYAGKPLKSGMRCFWKVRVWDNNGDVSTWSKPAWWEMALLDSEDWTGTWINDGKPVPENDEDFYRDDPAPLFRKEITVSKPVKRARLYISGLGYYEAYLNGKKTGNHVLDPGWTTYSRRVLYSVYDVTELLQKGMNALGVTLGNGWYNPLPMRMWGRLNLRDHLTVGRPRFIAQLNIEYNDGTRQSIVTDESWKTAEGPILRNDIYLGEVYDARCEKPGWSLPQFDDSSWINAKTANERTGMLKAQPQPPVKVTAAIKPVKLTQPESGVFIFDMGQNFSGWVTLRVKGPAGTKVKLRYGELLYPDGTLNVMTSTCGQIKPGGAVQVPGVPIPACQCDIYILKGAGEEVYTPRFTFHGFRYVEITGYPGKPAIDALEGYRLNAAVGNCGTFECSNPMFNRIQEMVCRTFLSNIFSVQSDCPQRERFGYGGDIVPTCEAFMFNFDMASFYPKVVRDFEDAARPDGGLTVTAPFVGIDSGSFGEGTGPVIGWVLAHPYLQQQLYRFYGDRRIIREQYEITKRSVELLRSNAKDHIIEHGISDHESIDPKPTVLTSTAFYYHHAKLMSQLALILGNDEDTAQYEELSREIRKAFITKFLKPGTGRFDTHTQACQAFALNYGLVPQDETGAAFDVLVSEIIDRHNGHLSTGIFGTKFLFDVLDKYGRTDIASTIVNQKTFPGWGHMLENGATTLWEHWKFSDNTFSHNHPMFGSVSEWFFRSLAGINPHPDAVGFDRIVIKPQPFSSLTWAKGSYRSIRGRIVSGWKSDNGTFTLNLTIPANTSAVVYIPTDSPEDVTESGKPAGEVYGVKYIRTEGNTAVYEIGSGEYRFVSTMSL